MGMVNIETQLYQVKSSETQEAIYLKKSKEPKLLSKQELKQARWLKILNSIVSAAMDSQIRILQWFSVKADVNNGFIYNA